jgi:hypothetical protein
VPIPSFFHGEIVEGVLWLVLRPHADGFHSTPTCRTYLTPLMQGEAYPPFKHGLPDYVRLMNRAVPKKLPTAFTL